MRLIIPIALIALLALPAQAEHCRTWTTTDPDVDTGIAPGVARYYFDADATSSCYDFCTYWIYEEANGIDGLQRGDEIRDDTCHGMIRADTIIF